MNGLSLCSGVGGLDLAIEIAFRNYRCIAAVENNPQAARRFKLRFPDALKGKPRPKEVVNQWLETKRLKAIAARG